MQTPYKIVRRIPNQQPSFSPAIPDILKRVYAARGVGSSEEIEYRLNKLHPADFVYMDTAVDLLVHALRDNQKILIVGDYDVDGATSTALCIRALRQMGAQQVDYLLPNRFEYGYGLSKEIVEVAKARTPDLIITVDNGISSIEGVLAAKQAGIRVLITDHHLPGEQLPQADAIINPNLPNDMFPSKCLAGVGVVFYLLVALRARLRDSGWFTQQALPEVNLAQYLDLVALGTVADVVPLDYNNRIFVSQGLKRIQAGQCIPGILALLNVGNRRYQDIVASDLGFVLGPRLNAAGRLEDMAVGVECLLSEDLNEALHFASILDGINKERREIEKTMQDQALLILKNKLGGQEMAALPAGVCLYDEEWHQGVIGILASRIKDRVHRPVIAFAPVSEKEIKGSARSVTGFHIRDALDAIATRHPQMISKFGGHAMAAGLSLSKECLPEFKQAFAQEVLRQMGDELGDAVLYSDGELSAAELSLPVAEQLKYAGPWGQAFPEPLFDGEFELLDYRVVGGAHLKLQLGLLGQSQRIDAIAFNNTGDAIEPETQCIKAAYHLSVNEFNGKRSVQLDVRYFEVLPAE